MQEVRQIELVFENCEDMTFLPEQIGAFWCSDITAHVGRIACNSISKQLWCKELFLELYPIANQKYDSFGHKSEDTAFERICRFDDITGIEITYADINLHILRECYPGLVATNFISFVSTQA